MKVTAHFRFYILIIITMQLPVTTNISHRKCYKRSASAHSTQLLHRKTFRPCSPVCYYAKAEAESSSLWPHKTTLQVAQVQVQYMCLWPEGNKTSASSRQCWHHMHTIKFAAAKAGKTLVHGVNSHGTSVKGNGVQQQRAIYSHHYHDHASQDWHGCCWRSQCSN